MSEPTKETRIIALGNQKGGVGKSTNTINIAAALGEMGFTCLIIDLDGNCGATISLKVPDNWAGIYEVMLGKETAADCVLNTDETEGILLPDGVSIIPGSRKMEQFDNAFRDRSSDRFANPADSLQEPLESLKGQYDYIFLDTAPNAYTPTLAAYKYAEYFVLTSSPDELGVNGLVEALQDIDGARKSGGNTRLSLLGVVICMADVRTKLAKLYIKQVEANFRDAGENGMFETTISRSTDVQQAQKKGLSIIQYKPTHTVADQYRTLAKEINTRIESSRAAQSAQDIAATPLTAEGVANAG